MAAATFTATNDSQLRPVITVQVWGIVRTSGCACTIEEGPGLLAESLNTPPGKSKASVGCCPWPFVPQSHQFRSPAWRRCLAGGWPWAQLQAPLRPCAWPNLVPGASSPLLCVGRRWPGPALGSVRDKRQGCLSCGRRIR